jgi:hypothetical protein
MVKQCDTVKEQSKQCGTVKETYQKLKNHNTAGGAAFYSELQPKEEPGAKCP